MPNQKKSFNATIAPHIAERDGGWFCHYCWIPIKRKADFNRCDGFGKATIDHKVPKAKGGYDHWNNLVLCCHHCNQEKDDQSYDSFYAKTSNRRKKRYEKRGIYLRQSRA